METSQQVPPATLGPPSLRVCARCRGSFAGDDTLAHDLDSGWWACPACREILLGPDTKVAPRRPAARS
jgi:hypothetical protein